MDISFWYGLQFMIVRIIIWKKTASNCRRAGYGSKVDNLWMS